MDLQVISGMAPLFFFAFIGLVIVSLVWSMKRVIKVNSIKKMMTIISEEYSDALIELTTAVEMGEMDPEYAQDKCDFLRDLYIYILQDIEENLNRKKTEGAVRLKK